MSKTILRVTLGQGRGGTQGREQRCEGVGDLARVISAHTGHEAWWSVHRWEGASRAARGPGEGDGWVAAQAIGLDFDASGPEVDGKRPHSPLPAETRAAFYAALTRGEIPCSMGHATPRGVRVLVVLSEDVRDRAVWDAAAAEVARRCASAIASLPLPDGWALRLDERASLKVGFLWTPRASVAEVKDGPPVKRTDEVQVVRAEAWTLAELGVEAPRVEQRPLTVGPPARPVVSSAEAAERFDEARARYLAEHPREYPRGGARPCPICCEEGGCCCWGETKGRPDRWTCFSSSHSEGGVRGGSSWGGDALDLDAHAAGLRGATAPAEHLRATGYLRAPAQGAARGEAGARIAAKPARSLPESKRAPAPAVALAREPGCDDDLAPPKPRLELIRGGPDSAPPRSGGLPWAGAPHGDELVVPEGYALDDRGVLKELSGRDGEVRYVLVYAAPIYISAQSEDIVTRASVLRVCWRMAGGTWREEDWPARQALDSRDLAHMASDARCPMSGGTAKAVAAYLEAFLHANRELLPVGRVSSSLGWVGRGGEGGYLLGSELLCAPAGDAVAFRGAGDGERQLVGGMERRGTLEGWQAAIAPMLAHPAASMALWAVFAAPPLELLDRPGFTVDFSGGGTTTGKSTVCRAAMAAVGDPRRICRSWEARQVGAERLLALHGGGVPLYLDDSRQALKPEEIGKVLMAVANGHGRTRGAPVGMQATAGWRTILLSSGEAPAVSYSEGGGEQARCISVTALPFGEKSAAAGEIAARMEQETERHYGHALPLFVERLRAKHTAEELRSRWEELAAQQTKLLAGSELGQRLAGHRAVLLLAAQLTRELGIVPAEGAPVALWGDAGEAAEGAAQAPEEERARRRLASWVAAEASGFLGSGAEVGEGPRVVLGRWYRDADRIAILPHILTDQLKKWGFTPETVIRNSAEKGWIIRGEGKHVAKKISLQPSIVTRAYVFKAAVLMGEED